MTTFTSFIRSAILAAAMALGASPAFAGPMYHVSIDTSAIAEASGLLDFALLSNAASPDLTTVTLTNFTGNFGAEYARAGEVSDITGGYAIGSGAGASYLTRIVNFGGMFGFNVGFADGFGGIDGVGLEISLFDLDMTHYLGLDGALVRFDLVPAMGLDLSFVTVSDNNAFATTSAIPEPSELLLMFTGLAMAGFMVRRRKHRA